MRISHGSDKMPKQIIGLTLTLVAVTVVGVSVLCSYGGRHGSASGQDNDVQGGAMLMPLQPNRTPAPPPPGYEKRGNCLVPKEAADVSTVAAATAGGQVFEADTTRYYSLSGGNCVTLIGAVDPPDWVPRSFENDTQAAALTPQGDAR